MKTALVGLASLVLLGSLYYLEMNNTPFLDEQNDLMTQFTAFKTKYNKKYASKEEDTVRFLIFTENVQEINAINAVETSFKLGVNKFADLTKQEYRAIYLGYTKQTTADTVIYLPTENLPNGVDWRQKGVVNQVKDQGQCGSCWAFSAVAGVESAYALKNGKLLSFSEQQVVDCSKQNAGCNGGDLPPAFDYIQSKGIELESDYAYKARDQSCKYSGSKVAAKITGYVSVPSENNDQLAAAVAQQPVPVCIEADSTVFQYYTSGVLDSDDCGTDLDHCVEVVGYDSQAWIVRNSWSEDWGAKGYIRIKKESGKSAGICGIALEGVYPTF